MEDYRLEQTGQEVQRILNGAAMDANLQAEVERATDAEGTLQENIDAEAQARQDADGQLQQGIDDEAQRAKDAEEANAGEIEGIKALIPSTASEGNKLADTNYVNSSIQTATAEYRGDYNVVTDLHLAIDATHAQIETLLPTVIAEADKNDYCYVMIPTSAQTPTEIAKIERYKMTSEGWKFEYDVNNSTFTAEEWAAIKSGITSGLVAKLNALPTNADLLLLLAGKQDVLTFDSVPVPESNNPVKSGGVYSAIDDEKTARLNSDTAIHAELDGLQAKVPATASSDNKLVDQNQMNSSISTATATFRGDWNVVSDLHLAVDATRAQIAALLPTVISTADNNDYCYVEIPTSAETPTQMERVERYKFNGTAWAYEYTLNNSGFTADQWAAINSMITSGLVAKLSALPTNADLLAMLAQKQDNLTFDSTPTENSTNPVTSGGVFAADKALSDAIEAILLLIPSAASSLNKLVDTSLMNSSISTATATFRGTYNLVSDLGLGIDATEGQIAAALLSAISTADNNDYSFVQIPTSAQTPAQIARTDRYKFNGTAWAFEYTLNTSGFTAAQWAAINSGVTDTLVAELGNIANLIPSEASQYNKLADKVYVITQIIAHIADFKGEYGTLLELQSVLNPKPGDLGIVRTKDNEGKDVYTFYQYKDSLWNEYYTLSYHPQIKPATTGTTGDYPYNGMGRVELSMNMVNDVNTLTQDMFYKGAQGFREPNTNTIFIIKYDFTLGEDITVPANCVLEFEGGSISGNKALDFSNTLLTGDIRCFCELSGTVRNKSIDVSCFSDTNSISPLLTKCLGICNSVYIPEGNWVHTTTIVIPSGSIVCGAGVDKTVIKIAAGCQESIRTDSHTIIQGLTIEGSESFPVSLSWSGFISVVPNGEYNTFTRIKFTKGSCGVFVNDGASNITVDSCIFYEMPIRVYSTLENPTGADGGYGINASPGSNNQGYPVKDITVMNCVFNKVVRHCCYIQNTSGFSFHDNCIHGAKSIDNIPFKEANKTINIYNSERISIRGNRLDDIWFFMNCDSHLTLPNGISRSNDILICDNSFHDCVGDAQSSSIDGLIIVQQSDRVTVSNNVMSKINGKSGSILVCEETNYVTFSENTIKLDTREANPYIVYVKTYNNYLSIVSNNIDASRYSGVAGFIASNNYFNTGSDNIVITNNIAKGVSGTDYLRNITNYVIDHNLVNNEKESS